MIHEIIRVVAMMVPNTAAFYTIQLAHASICLNVAQQTYVRKSFRTLMADKKCPNGILHYTYYYILPSGYRDGPSLMFHPSGYCSMQTYYTHDKQTGTCVQWYDNGTILSITRYRLDMQHGQSTMYFISGGLSFKGNYMYGKIVGKIKTWFAPGIPCSKNYVVDGQCASGKIWHIDGQLLRYDSKPDPQTGRSVHWRWRANGQSRERYECINGVRIHT